jgi:hypothetical protein
MLTGSWLFILSSPPTPPPPHPSLSHPPLFPPILPLKLKEQRPYIASASSPPPSPRASHLLTRMSKSSHTPDASTGKPSLPSPSRGPALPLSRSPPLPPPSYEHLDRTSITARPLPPLPKCAARPCIKQLAAPRTSRRVLQRTSGRGGEELGQHRAGKAHGSAAGGGGQAEGGGGES